MNLKKLCKKGNCSIFQKHFPSTTLRSTAHRKFGCIVITNFNSELRKRKHFTPATLEIKGMQFTHLQIHLSLPHPKYSYQQDIKNKARGKQHESFVCWCAAKMVVSVVKFHERTRKKFKICNVTHKSQWSVVLTITIKKKMRYSLMSWTVMQSCSVRSKSWERLLHFWHFLSFQQWSVW